MGRISLTKLLFTSALLLGVCLFALAQSSAPRPEMWATNGEVYAIAQTDDTVYIGGEFSQVGIPTGGLLALDPISGLDSHEVPTVNGHVWRVIPDGSGGWFIGGDFSHVNGEPRERLAHILASGQLDSEWKSNADGLIQDMELNGSVLYVVGRFERIDGSRREGLAALDAQTGELLAWDPDPDNYSFSVMVLNDVVHVWGLFDDFDGVVRRNFAAIDPVTALLTDPVISAGPVYCHAISNGIVYVGGSFDDVDGAPRGYAAAFDIETGDLLPWDPRLDNHVRSIHIEGDHIYLGGRFKTASGRDRVGIAMVDAEEGVVLPWKANIEATQNGPYVYDIDISGSTIYAAGDFSLVDGVSHRGVVALDAETGSSLPWDPQLNSGAFSVDIHGEAVLVGGYYTFTRAVERLNLAAFDKGSGSISNWYPLVTNGDNTPRIYTLTAQAETVYIGGSFTHIDTGPRNNLASVDAQSGNLLPWNPGADGSVREIVLHGSTLYVSGSFNVAGNAFRRAIAAIDTDTGYALPWYPNPKGDSSGVYAMAVSHPVIYLAGFFEEMGGQVRNNLAAVDIKTGLATDWNPNPNMRVYDVELGDNSLYICGQFTTLGGFLPEDDDFFFRTYLAEIPLDSQIPTNWNPNRELDWRTIDSVTELELGDDLIYVGGSFTSVGMETRYNVASLNLIDGHATDWKPEVRSLYPWYLDEYSYVGALSARDGGVFIGGRFRSVNGENRWGFAEFYTPIENGLMLTGP